MYRPMRTFGLVNRVLTIKIEKMNKNLNVLDLMQVKGGKRSESESITCIFTAAVKCESEAVSK